MPESLKNRVAIVTGASSGIGRETAMLLAREGASVVIAGRSAGKLEQVRRNIAEQGGRVRICVGDLRQEAHSRELVEAAQRHFGGLDIAINNAGILGALKPLPMLSLGEWRETLESNLDSAFLASKYQLPALAARGGGSLVFVSSFAGLTVGFPGMAAYSASKAALTGLCKVLAVEYAQQGIRVNALLPGGTETPMLQQFASSREAADALRALYPGRRLARPEEMARTLLFLVSDGAGFITGSSLLADGGISISRI